MNASTCPVCKSPLSPSTVATNTRTVPIDCPRCGKFLLTQEAGHALPGELERESLRWAITSHAIRQRQAAGGAPYAVTVTQPWLVSVFAAWKLPNPKMQADALVEYLGTAGLAPSHWVKCRPPELTGLL